MGSQRSTLLKPRSDLVHSRCLLGRSWTASKLKARMTSVLPTSEISFSRIWGSRSCWITVKRDLRFMAAALHRNIVIQCRGSGHSQAAGMGREYSFALTGTASGSTQPTAELRSIETTPPKLSFSRGITQLHYAGPSTAYPHPSEISERAPRAPEKRPG